MQLIMHLCSPVLGSSVGFFADVAAVIGAVEADLRDGIVGSGNGVPKILFVSHGGDGQHTTAGGEEASAIVQFGGAMKDGDALLDLFLLVEVVESGDDLAGLVTIGIALAGHHNSYRRSWELLDRQERRKPSFGAGEEDLGEVAIQERQHDFGFGVAKADVELDDASTSICDHDADVQHSAIDAGFIAQAFERWLDNLALDLLQNFGRDDRGRCVSAHAAGVLATVAIEDALVILRGGEQVVVDAVGDGEDAGFFARHVFFDDDALSGLAEDAMGEDLVERVSSLRFGLDDDDAFSCSEAIGFDDGRIVHMTQERSALDLIFEGEDGIASGGNIMALHEFLREGFGTFEKRGILSRTENRNAFFIERVSNTDGKRAFWADDDQVDPLAHGKAEDGFYVRRNKLDGFRNFRDTGITGRAKNGRYLRRLLQFPTNSVLARAAAKNKNSHVVLTIMSFKTAGAILPNSLLFEVRPLWKLQIYDDLWRKVGKAILLFFFLQHITIRMVRKNKCSTARFALNFAWLLLLGTGIAGCDRGAGEEVGTARKFADAVTRNNVPLRDSMIATQKFKDYFSNPYVSHDMLTWFRSFYDPKAGKFIGTAGADVDRNLTNDLEGALIDTAKIEETGMVRVNSPNAGEDAAFFWMVHQEGKPWKVAMVTKGESHVDFR
jgi:hypothetical protein